MNIEEKMKLEKDIEEKKEKIIKYNELNIILKNLEQELYELEQDDLSNYNEVHEISIGLHIIKPIDLSFKKKLFNTIKTEYIKEIDRVKKEIDNI